MNGVQVKISDIVNGGHNQGPFSLRHVFIKALWVDFGLKQIVIDYPNVGDCISNAKGSPIPWVSEILVLCGKEVLESSIDSSWEINVFEDNDKDMGKPQN